MFFHAEETAAQPQEPPCGSSQARPRILFIGAFNSSNPKVQGGQLQACTLLMQSSFGSAFDLVQIDTTQTSVPPPNFALRAIRALKRVSTALRIVFFSRVDALLIFCGGGASFLEKGVVVLVARALRKRVVLAPRSGFLLDDYKRNAWWRWAIRIVLRSSTVVICQGKTWKDFFVRAGAEPHRCRVVKNWVASDALVQLPLPPCVNELRILYLGWLEPEKGVFDLVEAIDLARASNLRVKAVLAGDGTARRTLEKELLRRGLDDSITLFGWANEQQKLQLMASSNVLVMPSYREGLPNAVLEAMAAARPVIATRVGAVPEVIEDGSNGLLIDAGDVSALAEALRKLHDEPWRLVELGAKAQATIKVHHDLEAAAQAICTAMVGRRC